MPQTIENTMRQTPRLVSRFTWFGGAPLRQLSLQMLFLLRIRYFASSSGVVASDAPNHRKRNASDARLVSAWSLGLPGLGPPLFVICRCN